VGSKQELILIDTNIFTIDLRYKRDINLCFFLTYPSGMKHAEVILSFLEILQVEGKYYTGPLKRPGVCTRFADSAGPYWRHG
jgi:hypothetical protein